jgi:hypothetical protein
LTTFLENVRSVAAVVLSFVGLQSKVVGMMGHDVGVRRKQMKAGVTYAIDPLVVRSLLMSFRQMRNLQKLDLQEGLVFCDLKMKSLLWVV